MSDQQPAQRMPRARSHKRLASCLWHNDLKSWNEPCPLCPAALAPSKGRGWGPQGYRSPGNAGMCLLELAIQFQQCMPVCLFVSGCFGMYMPACLEFMSSNANANGCPSPCAAGRRDMEATTMSTMVRNVPSLAHWLCIVLVLEYGVL